MESFEADNLCDDSEISDHNDTLFETLTTPDILHNTLVDNSDIETPIDSGIDQTILNSTDFEPNTPGRAVVPLSAQRVPSGLEEAAALWSNGPKTWP